MEDNDIIHPRKQFLNLASIESCLRKNGMINISTETYL